MNKRQRNKKYKKDKIQRRMPTITIQGVAVKGYDFDYCGDFILIDTGSFMEETKNRFKNLLKNNVPVFKMDNEQIEKLRNELNLEMLRFFRHKKLDITPIKEINFKNELKYHV